MNSRQVLINKLENGNVFWSYDKSNQHEISNDELIEKVLLFLDLEDIKMLFELFDSELIKKVWKHKILKQEPYYHNLNKFIAWFYFGELV